MLHVEIEALEMVILKRCVAIMIIFLHVTTLMKYIFPDKVNVNIDLYTQ